MKRKTACLLLMIMAIGTTGCGKTAVDSSEARSSAVEESTASVSVTEDKEENLSSESSSTDGTTVTYDNGKNVIYPGAIGFTDIPVGGTEELCSVRVPLNYIFAGIYLKDGNELSIPGMNATTTVEDSEKTGKFAEYLVYSFAMTAVGEGNVSLNMDLISSKSTSFNEIKSGVDSLKKIGNEKIPGYEYYYEDTRGKMLIVGVKISDEYTLEFEYLGDKVDQIPEAELAQEIYDLVTQVNK